VRNSKDRKQSSARGAEWMTSAEVQKTARITSCHLMHLREEGKLRFRKKGNAFLYWREDVGRVASLKAKAAGSEHWA
jgi:hypothetical protein